MNGNAPCIISCILLAISTGPGVAGQPLPRIIEVDPASPGRIFEGVGTLSAGASTRLLIDYPEPYRSDILDYLFKPNFGAAQHHIKVEIGADANSTIGSEPSHARAREEMRRPDFRRGYEYWLLQEARKRNPAIMTDMLEWGAPSWFSNDYEHATAFFSQDNADYIASALKGAQSEWGVKVDFTGVWNEGPYSRYPARDVQDWIVNKYRPALDRHGLKDTRLVAMDANQNQWFVVEWMKENRKLFDAIDIVGEHYPGGQSTPAAKAIGKPLWANEDAWLNDEWGGAVGMVKVCNRNYIDGRMTKTISWATINSFYRYMWNCGYPGKMRADSPWSGHYEVRSPIWAMAHICQFVQPGWRYLDSGCGYLDADKKNGTFVTLKAPDSNHYAVILETWGVWPKEVVFRLGASAHQGDVYLWETTEKEHFIRKNVLKPRDGEIRIKLESNAIYTLTTTTGQQKGVAAHPVPENKPFPLPYHETFEGYAAGVTPRYLANYSGAFEAATGDQGMVLRQVVHQRPIDWTYGGNHYPQVFVGGGNWTNYEVSCEVRLANSASAALYGRVKGVYRTSTPPQGYGLYLHHDGRWEVKFETDPSGKSKPLAVGVVGAPGAAWHKLALRFSGQALTCLIDGKGVASLETALAAAGAVGLGCDWGGAEFDNLQVVRLAETVKSEPGKGSVTRLVEAIRVSSANGENEIIKKDGKLKLAATVLPEHAAQKNVKWSVFDSGMRDTSTAAITQEGVLTAWANGMYKVQAESTDGTGICGVFTVNVSGQDP